METAQTQLVWTDSVELLSSLVQGLLCRYPLVQAHPMGTGIIVADSWVTMDSEEQIFVPGAEILSLLSLTKVFRYVLVRESFADASLICNFCDEAATAGISQEDEFCCTL